MSFIEPTGLVSTLTEKPSFIAWSLFIRGALAVKSVYRLEHLGIIHILCLCSNEIGQSDSQYLDNFEFKIFQFLCFSLKVGFSLS